MKLSVISELSDCNTEELSQIKKILRIGDRKGGHGAAIVKWSEELDSVIIFPGEDGYLSADGLGGGSGGAGAEINANLNNGAVIQISALPHGLKFTIPGYAFLMPWELLKDLEQKGGCE